MSPDLAEGHQVGGRGWLIRARPVELLIRRHADCIELESRIRRARRELGSARSGLPRGGGSWADGISLGAAITEFVQRSRGDVSEAERLGDPESAGLLAEIARVAETWLWNLATVPGNVRLARQPYAEVIG